MKPLDFFTRFSMSHKYEQGRAFAEAHGLRTLHIPTKLTHLDQHALIHLHRAFHDEDQLHTARLLGYDPKRLCLYWQPEPNRYEVWIWTPSRDQLYKVGRIQGKHHAWMDALYPSVQARLIGFTGYTPDKPSIGVNVSLYGFEDRINELKRERIAA